MCLFVHIFNFFRPDFQIPDFRLLQHHREQRKPMIVPVSAGPLLRLNVKTPAFDVLFQKPPRRKAW